MGRLFFVPQYPTPMRYQEWWYKEFPIRFRKYFDEVIVLGDRYLSTQQKSAMAKPDMFSPIQEAIHLEMEQIKELDDYNRESGDVLLLADLSFPGLFTSALCHKQPDRFKMKVAICHATSINNYDYFMPVRKAKWLMESGAASLFDLVVVASKYHQEKLGWKNTIRIPLPPPPFHFPSNEEKTRELVSASRLSIQKCNKKLEKKIERRFGPIIRKQHNSWEEYYKFLQSACILLITAKEETYGYQIFDALRNGCLPIAPNRYSYPEMLPKEFLYNDKKELFILLERLLECPHFIDFPEVRGVLETRAEKFYTYMSIVMG